jgi:hypothetical protein
MNGSFKKFLKRLLSLKNIVPLLVIVIAFAATFISNPFGLQLDQVILALLAFLAIDSLVERLETLHGIEMNVKRVRGICLVIGKTSSNLSRALQTRKRSG